MRLSLTFDTAPGTCTRCNQPQERVVSFGVLADDQSGRSDPLCTLCLFAVEGLVSDVPMQPLLAGHAPRRKQLKKAKKRSLMQEVDIATRLGGRTQPGSGNQPYAKGDIRKKGELRVEAKFTTHRSFSLKLDELDKIARECTPGEKPLFVIDFLQSGTRKLTDRVVVLRFEQMEELLNAARANR